VVVDCTGARIVMIPPDLVEKFIPRDRAFGILGQELERLEFLCCNRDVSASTSDLRL